MIEAAVAALDEVGPAALSLRDVSKRVGVSHAAPAHHFRDKAGLLTAVAAEGYERFVDELERAWSETGDFTEVGVAYVRFAIEHHVHFEVMFRIERLHPDDPALERARERSRRLLCAALHGGSDGTRRGLAAWSLVHGFAVLLLAGNLDGEVAADPEGAVREIVARLEALRGPGLAG
ncbi:TetR/AcrR family transcriptional regulator [Glycomyces xiaoerkulensis]|uniref:TetR/AcrR family transcriptional regulator n=1 Tax=Glycomyces xiaoerkulensis TaxID=2038139 RepID=UPI000C256FF2